jgi:hypothetical protein
VPSMPARLPKLIPTRPPTVIDTDCWYDWPFTALTSSVVGM